MNNIDIQEIAKQISEKLLDCKIKGGDFSDLGNEIGYVVGTIFSAQPMNEEEIEMFIFGFKHGVSLTNGTHP